ncbi:hypothetical protein [Prauserella muralis]|uniref:Uncharacterized protein n=1 Tax=Prauserella muralis TaxID=588067 RepID=A0A2V4AZJ8_9PSEU|nr:hypothetical protein [Prauserella muralis]PXY27420.1 hypothetical protein BAY60_13375 [Prauserella muralis]TWE22880.1 hypothetical protein FHX69_4136 [Prauserella muralis]
MDEKSAAVTDIVDAIDRALGCLQCGGPLGDSPSTDFCREACQRDWHTARADAATDTPVDVEAVHRLVTSAPLPPPPVKLTRAQIAALQAHADPSPPPPRDGALGTFFGAPVIEVDTDEESTPHQLAEHAAACPSGLPHCGCTIQPAGELLVADDNLTDEQLAQLRDTWTAAMATRTRIVPHGSPFRSAITAATQPQPRPWWRRLLRQVWP